MVVTPIPVGLLVAFVEPCKLAVFAMVLSGPHAVGAIFAIVPLMVVVVIGVVKLALVPMIVLSQERRGSDRRGSDPCRAEQGPSQKFCQSIFHNS